MGDNDIAALAVVCIFGLPVLAWIAVRLMQHRERLEMIRHGMNPPQRRRRRPGRRGCPTTIRSGCSVRESWSSPWASP